MGPDTIVTQSAAGPMPTTKSCGMFVRPCREPAVAVPPFSFVNVTLIVKVVVSAKSVLQISPKRSPLPSTLAALMPTVSVPPSKFTDVNSMHLPPFPSSSPLMPPPPDPEMSHELGPGGGSLEAYS